MIKKFDVLILEDDTQLLIDLLDFFKIKKINASGAQKADEFINSVEKNRPKVIIVDLVLPDGDGMDVISVLKKNGFVGKTVILSALDDDQTQVQGYATGADVYLTKDSSLQVIAACVKRLLGSAEDHAAPLETGSTWEIDLITRQIRIQGKTVLLTTREHQVLTALMQSIGQPVPRHLLIGSNVRLNPSGERRVDAVISRLKRKVKQETDTDLPIQNAFSYGYVFTDAAKVLKPVV